MTSAPDHAVRRPWSVRVRILATLLVIATLGLVIAGAAAYFGQRDRILSDIDSHLLSRVEIARLIATGASAVAEASDPSPAEPSPAPLTTTREALEAVLARVVPGQHESTIGLIDGRAAFVPGVPVGYRLDDAPEFIARVVLETGDGTVRLGTSVSRLGHLRYVAVPIAVAADPEAGLFVMTVDIDAELEHLDAAFATYAVVAAATIIAIGLVGWFLAGRLLSPVRRLREAASRIGASDLSERLPVTGHDDLSELTRTVNEMFARLEESQSAQRRLLDDVRHELKTPITIVRGHLELLDPSDAGEVRSVRALAVDELDRMTGLVDDIESLAEVRRELVQPVPTDVAMLTDEVFAKASGISDHPWVLAERCVAVAWVDPVRVTQAWLQVVDNAAKYSPSGSEIRLGSTRVGDAVELWVADEGPGIPAGAEDRIFERFGRVDTGRGIEGSGLGLPIVRAIAEAHGGRVAVASSDAGSRFALVLPLEPIAGPAAVEKQ